MYNKAISTSIGIKSKITEKKDVSPEIPLTCFPVLHISVLLCMKYDIFLFYKCLDIRERAQSHRLSFYLPQMGSFSYFFVSVNCFPCMKRNTVPFHLGYMVIFSQISMLILEYGSIHLPWHPNVTTSLCHLLLVTPWAFYSSESQFAALATVKVSAGLPSFSRGKFLTLAESSLFAFANF